MVTQNELMIVSGQLMAYVINGVLGNLVDNPGIWRVMLLVATLPAVILWFGGQYLLLLACHLGLSGTRNIPNHKITAGNVATNNITLQIPGLSTKFPKTPLIT